MRGTFANIRLRNEMVPGTEGGWTTTQPGGEPVFIYDAAMQYAKAGTPLVIVAGRLERRDGVTNVVAASVGRLERPDLPLGEVRHIEPRRVWSNDEAAGDLRVASGVGAEAGNGRDGDVSDLRAVMPRAHSFGRRG